jgi:flagellar hook-length control protein FliK
MSTAAALLTGLTPPSAVGTLPAGGDPIEAGAGSELAFQLLIAGFGTVQPLAADLGAGVADAGVPAKIAGSHAHGDDAHGHDDQSLLEIMAALSAWQLPVAPPGAPYTAVPDSTEGGADAAPQGIGVSAAGVDSIAIDALRIDGKAQQLAPQSAQQLVQPGAPSGDTALARAAGADATPPAIGAADKDAQTVAVTDPQWTEAFTAAATTLGATVPPKPASAGADNPVAAADATASSNLLRMPVVSNTVTRTVAVPVHDPRWPEAVATQIRWAVADGVQSATLKLVPEHLGPVELRIELKDNQVNVNFGANQADTRQTLQDSLPRLREVLVSRSARPACNRNRDVRHIPARRVPASRVRRPSRRQ